MFKYSLFGSLERRRKNRDGEENKQHKRSQPIPVAFKTPHKDGFETTMNILTRYRKYMSDNKAFY
ncbi:8902_t:CDS:2 [Funneliformis mosseae]|uniref:8902_t:CDS:1 n=1 Tax=Funneliformis mosseae TaxID=27381 RepID=A0A9N9F3T0_FUNMO|nr:8902_t:CDS:2 [Funneliformis mosseae]